MRNPGSESGSGGLHTALFSVELLYPDEASRVETVLRQRKGVKEVQVDPDSGKVRVTFHASLIEAAKLRDALVNTGYSVSEL